MIEQCSPINRNQFLERIEEMLRSGAFTFVTGIRRCGKSFLLREVIAHLKEHGVDDAHIIYLDFEKFVFAPLRTQRELKNKLRECAGSGEHLYIFLDEVQCVSGWDKALAPLADDEHITLCSAASGIAFDTVKKKKILGSKWNELKLTPLSYAEYKNVDKGNIIAGGESEGLLRRALLLQQNIHAAFERYVERGGFPATIQNDDASLLTTLNDIYASILHHDVIRRLNIKNTELLERIIKHIFEHLGEECSAGKLAALFKRQKYTKNLSMVNSLLRALETAQIIVRVRVINLESKKILAAHSKYYAGDHALFYAVAQRVREARGVLLETILVNELRRRGYAVYTGCLGALTIDFIAQNEERTLCIQTGGDAAICTQKAEALRVVCEQFDAAMPLSLFIVYLDAPPHTVTHTGISVMTLPDFLISTEY